MGMSNTRSVTLVVKMVLDRGAVTPMEWRTRAKPTCPTSHGKPTDLNLAAHVAVFEASTAPGGVNAHIGATKVVSAQIVRQSTNETLASYKRAAQEET